MFKVTLIQFIVLALACVVLATRTGDGWSDVVNSPIYQGLVQCAQGCILYVSQFIGCDTYDCICSGGSGGTNFNNSLKNITECAKQSCSSSDNAYDAAIAFRNLCLLTDVTSLPSSLPSSSPSASASPSSAKTTTSTGSAQSSSLLSSSVTAPSSASSTATPLLLIKPSKYDYLNPCSKFCLNSCRDTNGTVNEPKCNPSEKSEGWGQYKGLADQLRCRTAECLCASGAFNITFGKLYQSGVKYCNLLPSTADLPSPEYTRLQGVLADYCTDNNFRPDGWYLEVEGQPPGAKPGAKGLSTDSKIALGIGLGIGIFTLVLQAVSTVSSWRTYNSDREYRRYRL